MTECYPSWTVSFAGNIRDPQTRYNGVVKQVGTDAWLLDCREKHPTRKEALACARGFIERNAHMKLGKKR